MNQIVPFQGNPVGEIIDAYDVHLRPGDAIELLGKTYVVQSRSKKIGGYIFTDPAAPGDDFPMSCMEIKDWYFAEKLRFISKDEGSLPIGVRDSLRRSMRTFSNEERHEIVRRLRYCLKVEEVIDHLPRTTAVMQPICDEVALLKRDTEAHSWGSVYRWWQRWRASGQDARSLAPSTRHRGNRSRKVVDYKLLAMREGVVHWLSSDRPNMSTSYNKVVLACNQHLGGEAKAKQQKLPYPSLAAFREECHRENRTIVVANRMGAKRARYEMHPVGAGPDTKVPFERVEADFKYMKVMVVDDRTNLPLGTPYLMAAIDCYSGCIAGFDIGFEPPSYLSAARCLKHLTSIKDLSDFPRLESGEPAFRKNYPINGVPKQLFFDNDMAFHSESMYQSAKALKCHVNFVPRGQPWRKGRIERFWATLGQSFTDMFPGKVFLRTEEQNADYDATDDAVITLNQLRFLITKAIVDIYHEGIDEWTGKKRIELWNEAVARNPPTRVPDNESLIELVGAYVERKAERRGIRLFGLRYNSPLLASFRDLYPDGDPRVEVRYDPQDISRIWVIDRDHRRVLCIPCTRIDYATGLSSHQHRVIRRRVADRGPNRRLEILELINAKAELFALGQDMLGNKRSRRLNSRIAQFLGIGRDLIDPLLKRVSDPEASARAVELDEDQEDLLDTADDVPPAATTASAATTADVPVAVDASEPVRSQPEVGELPATTSSPETATAQGPTAPPPNRSVATKPKVTAVTKAMKVSYDD